MTENYIKPEDVSPEDAQKVLDFLNSAQSAAEIAEAVEIAHERDVGIIVAQHILDRRKQLGKFTNLQQVADVWQVGPERFSEIISTLRERQPAETAATTSAEQEEVPDVALPEMSLPRMTSSTEIAQYEYRFRSSTSKDQMGEVVGLRDANGHYIGALRFQDDSATLRESFRMENSQWVDLYYPRSLLPQIIDMLRNEKPVYLEWHAEAGEKKLRWCDITTRTEAVGEEETK